MLQIDFKIAALIAKYVIGHLEPHEETELDEWKNESTHNRLLFDRLVHPLDLQQLQQMAAHYDAHDGWSNYLKKQRKQKRRVIISWTKYAAIFLIMVATGFLYITYRNSASNTSVSPLVVSELIIPGGTKATLTLADGSAVALDEYNDYKLEEIQSNSGIPIENAPIYHKIETPRGGEYSFTLSDGTLVRLNALSILHFPIDFGDHPRKVELEGEAFFEVANNGKPFTIRTADMLIEVMGTSFNVSSYSDETCCSVTLVDGSLRIESRNNGDCFLLTPSQQVMFDRVSGEITVHQVDASSYIAWTNGMFYFKDWTLESIMHYLSRWYNIDEVNYKDEELKSIMFGCKFSKYDDIDRFLRAFERTGKIKYTIQDKTIFFNQNE